MSTKHVIYSDCDQYYRGGSGHRAEEFKIRGNLPVCVRNVRRGWSLVPSTSFSTRSRSGNLESFIELFLKTTARGQADGRSGSEGVLR